MAKKVQGGAVEKTGVDRWREATHSDSGSESRGAKKRVNPVARAARRTLAAGVALSLAAGGCAVAFRGSVKTAVDLAGGNEVAFTATKSDGSEVESADLSSAAGILRSRLAEQGVVGFSVEQGDGGLLVQLPSSADAASLAGTVGQTGELEFVRVDQISDAEALAKLQGGSGDVELEDGTYTAFLDGSHVASAEVSRSSSSSSSSSSYSVNVTFDSEGAEQFADVTGELASSSGQIAIVVDGVVKSAPTVSSKIEGGQVSISGGFTLDEARQLKSYLDSGTLPVELEPAEPQALAPKVDVAVIAAAAAAALVAFAAVAAALFRVSGLVSALAPLETAALGAGCLGVASAAGASFPFSTLSLAAIALSAAASAACSTALLSRAEHEYKSGKSLRSAASSVADAAAKPAGASMAALLVAGCVLLAVGPSDWQGAAVSLAFGLASAAASLLLVAIPLLRSVAFGAGAKKNPAAWGFKRTGRASGADADGAGPADGDPASGAAEAPKGVN